MLVVGRERSAQAPGLPCRWIGNAAEDGKMGTVFARLKVPSPDGSGALDDHGVHAFIVPLRDDSGNNMPGVEIRDCGYKVGHWCLSVAAVQTTRWGNDVAQLLQFMGPG